MTCSQLRTVSSWPAIGRSDRPIGDTHATRGLGPQATGIFSFNTISAAALHCTLSLGSAGRVTQSDSCSNRTMEQVS